MHSTTTTGNLGKPPPERLDQSGLYWSKRWWGWQWRQLDHMQSICSGLQTHNHASTSSRNFLQVGRSSWCPINSVKALNTITYPNNNHQRQFTEHIQNQHQHQPIPASGWQCCSSCWSSCQESYHTLQRTYILLQWLREIILFCINAYTN